MELEKLKKTSTEKLIAKLVKHYGYDEKHLKEKTRTELIDICLLHDDPEETVTTQAATVISSETDKMFQQMMQMFIQERRDRADREQREREEQERKERLEREERELQRLEKEDKRRRKAEKERQEKVERDERDRAERERWETLLKVERDHHIAELEHDRDMRAEERKRLEKKEQTREAATKKYGDIMKNVLPKMPDTEADVPIYMDTVDNMFKLYAVPDDIRSALLMPYLSEKAKKFVCKMTSTELENYGELKKAVLREFRLTPRQYLKEFDTITKKADETWTSFARRLTTLWQYYMRSRDVSDKDKIIELLISDRLRNSMSPAMKKHVLFKEGDKWFDPKQMCDVADAFEANGLDDKSVHSSASDKRNNFVSRGHNFLPRGDKPPRRSASADGKVSTSDKNNPHSGLRSLNPHAKKNCFTCGSIFHLAKDCPDKEKAKKKSAFIAAVSLQTNTQMLSSLPDQQRSKRWCTRCRSSTHNTEDCWSDKSQNHNSANTQVKTCRIAVMGQQTEQHTMMSCSEVRFDGEHIDNDQDNWIFSLYPRTETDSITTDSTELTKTTRFSVNNIELSKMKTIPVIIAERNLTALYDSGCEINVINKNICSFPEHKVVAKVTLTSPLNPIGLEAEVKRLPFKINRTECEDKVIWLTCAIANLTSGAADCLITSDAYEELMYATSHDQEINRDDAARVSAILANEENKRDDEKEQKESYEDDNTSPALKLADEQRQDVKLTKCFELAMASKANYYIRKYDNLLFHIDEIEGQKYHQFVLPSSRIKQVLETAHDSRWGGHLAAKKTTARIKHAFYWPTIKQDVQDYCSSCSICQLHRPVTTHDRVPIVAVTRPEDSFDTVNVDLIGPFDPKSTRGHSYVLCMICQCTRWPEAICLKSATAKNTCDALLQIFSRTGVPRVIVMDNATNFTSALTQEFLARIGCSPRFSTPYHAEGNSLVERYNQILKRMIQKTVHDNPRGWDKDIPFLLWAYREVPNETTGLSPYQLVHGKPGRGPLQLLKENWCGEMTVPPSLNKSAEEYLNDLKERLEISKEYASENAKVMQEKYINNYNMRCHDKSFEIGEDVLILMSDTHNKLYSRWTGPARIVRKLSPYSYEIQTEDGTIKHLHANKIRKFIVRVQTTGIVKDEDDIFGEIEVTPVEVMSKSGRQFDLDHLTPQQQHEIRQVLMSHESVFNDNPGTYNIGEHVIRLKEGYEPKRQKPYRLPERLKQEVETQITELLEQGLIRPANSPFAHPIVCVAKRDSTIRICTDFRSTNAHTIDDCYPMPNIQDVLYKVGRATWITVFDCSKGYYQIKMAPESIDKTTFVTGSSAYSWLRMPFGLKNAGSTYQRVMDTILKPHGEYAVAYIDDVAVFSDDWHTHLRHVSNVLQAFEDAGITLKLKKSKFAHHEISHLGHRIGSGKIYTDDAKVEAIRNIQSPTTKKQLRSVLGLMSYYRAFVPHFGELTAILCDLTKTRAPMELTWTPAHESAFQQVKDELCRNTVLYVPDMTLPFLLQCDASNYAVGCCLAQEKEAIEYPVAYASCKLTGNQLNWSTVEKEAYAILFGLKKFDVYLYGSKVIIYTDHNPLQYLTQTAPKNARLMRWSLAIQRYNIEIRHRKGKHNANCDALSRLC